MKIHSIALSAVVVQKANAFTLSQINAPSKSSILSLHEAHDKMRRRTLYDLVAVNTLPFFDQHEADATSTVTTTQTGDAKPIADFPMRR